MTYLKGGDDHNNSWDILNNYISYIDSKAASSVFELRKRLKGALDGSEILELQSKEFRGKSFAFSFIRNFVGDKVPIEMMPVASLIFTKLFGRRRNK